MSRVFGPIMTTGVVLGTAAVVVANPLGSPRADIQIPAVALSSGSSDALGMLDENFLRALAPEPTKSTTPLSVLKDVVSALVANAATLGRNSAVSGLLPDGTDPATLPALTSTTQPYPYVAEAPAAAPLAPPVLAPSVPGSAAVAPVEPVQSAASLEAAAAVVDTVASGAAPIINTINTDMQWAVDRASEVVSALPQPPAVLSGSGAIGERLSDLSSKISSVASNLASALPKPPPMPAVPTPAPGLPQGGLLGGQTGSVDGNKVSPARRGAPKTGADGPRDSAGHGDSAPADRNGE